MQAPDILAAVRLPVPLRVGASEPTALVDFAGNYLASCRARGLSAKTLRLYGDTLIAFGRGCATVPGSPEAIEGYLALRGPSAYTRHAHFRVLRSFYRWLHERYGLADPMRLLRAPVLRPKPMRTLSMGELTRLLEATEGSVRDRALVLLLVDTGLRIGEAHSVQPEDVGDGVITVRGKTGERIVPVSTLVLRLLRGVLPWAGAKGLLTLSGLQQVVRRMMARAGIAGARASPHTLRHSFAKQYLMAGGDVFSLQRIMGHRELATTQRYLALVDGDIIAQHRRFSPLVGLLGVLGGAN